MDIEKIRKILSENMGEIRSQFHVMDIGIFGSYVLGYEKASSDIDILVDFKKGYKDFFNYMRLKYYLEELLEQDIDLVIKTAIKPRLREKILNQAVYV